MRKYNKNIYGLMLAGAVLMGMSSCGDDFFEQKPADSVPAETAIQSSSDLASARAGMYAVFKGNSKMVD